MTHMADDLPRDRSEKVERARQEILGLLSLLIFGVSLRLVRISRPFVEEWAWREADVAMIAENFYRNGFNILYPQINWVGRAPGYVGSEFPLVPFIAALGYLVFGVHEWVGRAVSVVSFAVSLPIFYLLVRKVFNRRSAAFAACIYVLVPLSIFSSRCFMSDMASLSFSIVALYVFSEWLDAEQDWRFFTGAVAAASLAILLKLPAVIIGLPLMYMAWERHGTRLLRQRGLWVFTGASLVLPVAWYSHAYQIAMWHPPHHLFGEGGVEMVSLSQYLEIVERTLTSGLLPVVAGAMFLGLLIPSRAPFGWVFHWWLIAACVFVVVAGVGSRHAWYQLPVVPVAAALAGRACDWAWLKFARQRIARVATAGALGVFLGSVAVLAYLYVSPLYAGWAMPLFSVGTELNRIADTDALVVVADDGVPTALYYARRKGWHFPQGSVLASEKYPVNGAEAMAELEKRRQEGAAYVAFTRYTRYWLTHPGFEELSTYLESRYRRVGETAEYVIFALPRVADEH